MYSDLYHQYGDSTTSAPPLDPYADPPYSSQSGGPGLSSKGTATANGGGGAGEPTQGDRAPVERPAPSSYDRRSRSRSPLPRRYRSPARSYHSSPAPPPRRPSNAPVAPLPSRVLGVFGLSIRTQERDLEDEFGRFGRVEKAVIVYDQRSDRSRGFGFVTMTTLEEATRCIQELNGIELNSRRIRVDYSVTDRPHSSTPGEYMGFRRGGDDRRRDYDRGGRYDRHERDRDRYDRDDRRDRDRDHRYRTRDDRDGGRGGGGDRDRDPFGRDQRDWRDRRSPAPGAGRRYSPIPPGSGSANAAGEGGRRRSSSPAGRSPLSRRDYDAELDRPAPRW